MQHDYWLERWERGETGFHQDEIHPSLRRWWPQLQLAPGSLVFAPLCGKSRDLLWLREQGCRVLGVEISPLAVEALFRENGLTPRRSSSAKFERCECDGLQILCGDFFDLNAADLQGVAAVYDRAALIALPPQMRARYARHLLGMLPPGARIFLVAFDYPQQEMAGPPFSVTPGEMAELFGDRAEIVLLESRDVLEQNPRFRERGLGRLWENVHLLRLHPASR